MFGSPLPMVVLSPSLRIVEQFGTTGETIECDVASMVRRIVPEGGCLWGVRLLPVLIDIAQSVREGLPVLQLFCSLGLSEMDGQNYRDEK